MSNPFRPIQNNRRTWPVPHSNGQTTGRNDVPIIGLTHKAFECLSMVTAQCLCAPDNQPFIITGVDQAKVCVKCRKAYGITAVHFDRRKGNTAVSAEVGCLGIANAANQLEPQAEQPAPQSS